jgi:hypothetical protein
LYTKHATNKCQPSFLLLISLFFLPPSLLLGDWRDEIGYTRLKLLAEAELPTSPTQGISQVEAPASGNYAPDINNTNFTGKSFTLKSGSSGTSDHASNVATYFYGNSTSLLTGILQADIYEANAWLGSGFLKTGSFGQSPAIESRAVQNHSWIGPTFSSATEAGKRLDYAIDRDGFVCVVGENNGNSTVLPELLGQSYHTISVGLVNGAHSAGFTTIDTTGRIKPDIVAPEGATSYATSMVSSSAALLHSKIGTSLSGANKPRVIKALLLASATKDTVASWQNTSSRPLDLRYGAGELNINHAYNALRAGSAAPSSTTSVNSRGWSADSVSSQSSKTYFFSISQGSNPTPFCAALTWHRALSGFNYSTSTMQNLSLRLYQASGFTLGNVIAESLSPVDNVELVYQSALPAGRYAIVVGSTSSSNTAYGLAWHSLPSVRIAVTSPIAREVDLQQGVFTISRSGDTSLPLYVPLQETGSAVPTSHYQTLPTSVIIPAGQSTTTLPLVPYADDIAQGSRTVSLSISADFSLVRDSTEVASVTIEDKPFDNWRFQNFTELELNNGGISSAEVDHDRDGLANLMEYALGLSPNNFDSLPSMASDLAGYLTLTITKNPNATDIKWSAEITGDLSTWSTAEILANTSNSFQARDTILMENSRQRMIRLKVTRP